MAPDLTIHTDQSARSRRSQSISSDRPSLGSIAGFLSPPSTVSPDPAFIAASAASQIVTNDHDSHADAWFDQHGIEPSGETALVAPPALKLVNRFLDQLLFNCLSIARSTSLASLRPAVAEVLKAKLSKEAIAGADQELNEYLGGGEEEELMAFHNGLEPSGDWDLELVWKRTRLRCMVYSSLGDMEEEDEDFYTEQEHLDGPPGSTNRFSNNPGVVSPAVAIFLTSILEFMGEQVLVVAGQAAYYRQRIRIEKEEKDGSHTPAEIAERVVVEENDMERVALDRTLGRLWRGWKKRIRSSTTSVSMARSFSRESMRSQPYYSRTASLTPDHAAEEDDRRPSMAAVLAEYEHAALIPLPMRDDDIREIEIPGLAPQCDDEESEAAGEEEALHQPRRIKSMMIFTHGIKPQIKSAKKLEPLEVVASGSRKRANSLPLAPTLPFRASKRQKPSADEPAEEIQSGAEVEKEVTEVADKAANESASKKDLEDKKSEVDADEETGVLAGILTGAAAIGATAVAGIVAAAKGEAPQTEAVETDEPEIEDFTEEAQIMTSSRVSISGRMSPEEGKEVSSRRSSVRATSVHSLRLIEVTAPRSPARSRQGSVDAADYVGSGRPNMAVGTNEVYPEGQSPRMGSPVSRGPTASPIGRNGSSMSVRLSRNSVGDSISEAEERVLDEDLDPTLPIPRPVAATMQSDEIGIPISQTSSPTSTEPAAFVLAPAPIPRNPREITSAPRVEPVSQSVSNVTNISRTSDTDSRVPPLTPLQETMEGARDTSGNFDSFASSTVTRSRTDNTNGHSPTTSRQTNNTRSSPPRKAAPDNIAKGQRRTHTSGSGSSSGSNKLKPVRTSEESRSDTKGQSFEQLIRSDQTIQYTLTPQNMRDIEAAPDSPRYSTPPIASLDARPVTSRSHSSSFGKYNGLTSNPPTEVKSTVPSKPFKPVPRPQVMANTGSRLRPNAPQARDARVDRDSIGDFAEFIRSTGPANSYEPVPTRTLSTNRGANGASRNVSSGNSRTGTANSMPKRAASSAGRSKLQARDAVVPRGDSVSDLIDFVRSGPQVDKQDHRIPRTVAPFRTTMDSDQMAGAIGGKAVDATLPDVGFSATTTSVTSSVNSQSALLNGSRNKAIPAQNPNMFDEEDMMPKRKTRRVRDPYAIDFSDEEDNDLPSARPPPIKEESLAEFLRNVPPPPEPVSDTRPTTGKMKKKASSTSLMSRFGRSGSTSNPSIPPKPQSKGNDSTISSGARKAPPYAPIAAKYSTTSATTSNQPRNGNYVSQLDSARNKVAQKSYQPREAVYHGRSQTSDLADFLMRSEPPSQSFTPPLQKEEASAFQRMFGRKKAH